ncbi:MAG: hypothetical protein IPP71_18380 [Bacteroidetes bacterium]|nr:hypothetical protein [Bacteroidota bacterium]
MKTIILIIISIAFNNYSYAQWQWAQHFGGNSFNNPNEFPTSTLIVGSNNFTIGVYGGTLFMPNDTLFSNGDNDLFITKCDLSGNQLWSKTIGGKFSQTTDSEYGFGVYDSLSDCIYISGQVIGEVNFGSIVFNGSTVRSDIFTAKMDLNGNFIWVKKAGAQTMTEPNHIYQFKWKNLYCCSNKRFFAVW